MFVWQPERFCQCEIFSFYADVYKVKNGWGYMLFWYIVSSHVLYGRTYMYEPYVYGRKNYFILFREAKTRFSLGKNHLENFGKFHPESLWISQMTQYRQNVPLKSLKINMWVSKVHLKLLSFSFNETEYTRHNKKNNLQAGRFSSDLNN